MSYTYGSDSWKTHEDPDIIDKAYEFIKKRYGGTGSTRFDSHGYLTDTKAADAHELESRFPTLQFRMFPDEIQFRTKGSTGWWGNAVKSRAKKVLESTDE